MMSNRGNNSAQSVKQVGAAILFIAAVIIFVFSFAIGESRAEKRAAKVNKLTAGRLEVMNERLELCKEEHLALRKGKATSESTVKTMARSREILVKEIAMLQDTIKMDRQAVNDCEEEADAERKARTGTTNRDAGKALDSLRAEKERLGDLINEVRHTGGNIVSSSSSQASTRRLIKRLVRAYALENKELSLKLHAILKGSNKSSKEVGVEEKDDGERSSEEGQPKATAEGVPLTTQNPLSKPSTNSSAPSREELRALLFSNFRRKIAESAKRKQDLIQRYHYHEKKNASLVGEDEENDEKMLDAYLVESSLAESSVGNKASSSSSSILGDKKAQFEALLEDIEEGLQAIQDNVNLPEVEQSRIRQEQEDLRVRSRAREANLKLGYQGLQPRRRQHAQTHLSGNAAPTNTLAAAQVEEVTSPEIASQPREIKIAHASANSSLISRPPQEQDTSTTAMSSTIPSASVDSGASSIATTTTAAAVLDETAAAKKLSVVEVTTDSISSTPSSSPSPVAANLSSNVVSQQTQAEASVSTTPSDATRSTANSTGVALAEVLPLTDHSSLTTDTSHQHNSSVKVMKDAITSEPTRTVAEDTEESSHVPTATAASTHTSPTAAAHTIMAGNEEANPTSRSVPNPSSASGEKKSENFANATTIA